MPPGRRGNRHETTWDRCMATLPTDWPGWHSYPCPRYPLSVQHSQDERQRTKRGPQGPRGAAGGGKGRASSTTMDLRESGEVSVRGHRRKEVARVSHGQGLSSSLGISQASWTGCGGREPWKAWVLSKAEAMPLRTQEIPAMTTPLLRKDTELY